jgi:hypothetical protein
LGEAFGLAHESPAKMKPVSRPRGNAVRGRSKAHGTTARTGRDARGGQRALRVGLRAGGLAAGAPAANKPTDEQVARAPILTSAATTAAGLPGAHDLIRVRLVVYRTEVRAGGFRSAAGRAGERAGSSGAGITWNRRAWLTGPLKPAPGGHMDAEHVQAAPNRPRRNGRRRESQLPLALAPVGVVLVFVAMLGLQGSFSLTITEPPYGNLIVHCGTLANATNSMPTLRLSNESRAKLRTMGSPSEFVVALEKLKNSCRIAGQLRIDLCITVGILGMGGVVAGFLAFGRNKGAEPPSRPESPSSA